MNNFQAFLASPPNEKGGTLAGLAGSLAFLWIIITVLLQGKELSLQREELERMRTTQQEQTNLLRQEETRRASFSIDEKIKSLIITLQNSLPDMHFFEFELEKIIEGQIVKKTITFNHSSSSHLRGDAIITDWEGKVDRVIHSIFRFVENEGFKVVKPKKPDAWVKNLNQIRAILNLGDSASEHTKEWLTSQLKLPNFEKNLKRAMENDLLWAAVENIGATS